MHQICNNWLTFKTALDGRFLTAISTTDSIGEALIFPLLVWSASDDVWLPSYHLGKLAHRERLRSWCGVFRLLSPIFEGGTSCSDTLTWVGWLAVTDLSEAAGQKSTFGSTWEHESLENSHLKFSVKTCSCLRKEGRHEFERSSFSKKKQSQQAVKANNQPTIEESCSFPLNSDLKSHF